MSKAPITRAKSSAAPDANSSAHATTTSFSPPTETSFLSSSGALSPPFGSPPTAHADLTQSMMADGDTLAVGGAGGVGGGADEAPEMELPKRKKKSVRFAAIVSWGGCVGERIRRRRQE